MTFWYCLEHSPASAFHSQKGEMYFYDFYSTRASFFLKSFFIHEHSSVTSWLQKSKCKCHTIPKIKIGYCKIYLPQPAVALSQEGF